MKFVCNCLLMLFLAAGLVACNRTKPEKPVNYSKIMYKNVTPFAHSVNPSVASYNIPASEGLTECHPVCAFCQPFCRLL